MDTKYILLCLCFLWKAPLILGQSNTPPGIPPNFPVYFEVLENATVGSTIFILSGLDQDKDQLSFSTSTPETGTLVDLGSPSQDDTVDGQWNCNVILKAELDRDNVIGEFNKTAGSDNDTYNCNNFSDLKSPVSRQLFFTISDGQSQVPVGILMIINDVNDNPPSFTKLPYRTSIREDVHVGTEIFTVTATDPDNGLGASIIYTIQAANPTDATDNNRTFQLQPRFGNINLTKKLDYETRTFYHLKVLAKDEGTPPCPGPGCLCKDGPAICNPDPVDLFITVIDVQDTPPVFERLPYLGSVSEDKPVGYSILQVTAADGDRGVAVPNVVHFSFSGGNHSLFAIDENNGTISVNETLDADTQEARDRGGLYVFNVKATEVSSPSASDTNNEKNSSSVQVSITVTDVNDNAPKFNLMSYTAKVLENTPVGVPVTLNSSIEVEDLDQGVRSTFTLYLEKDGLPYYDFSTLPAKGQTVQGKSTVIINVNNSTVLDYETTKNITFKIKAQEEKTSTDTSGLHEATVTVYIEDTNDNSPEFSLPQTNFSVSEDVAPGFSITTVTATDHDSGDYGHVTYSFEDTGGDGDFNISTLGEITVSKTLDREKRASYTLIIVATDSPNASESQRRRTRQPIQVTVTDVNDNAPKWIYALPSISILESTSNGTNVTDLRATDPDERDNGEIEYSVLAGFNGSDLFDVRGGKGDEAAKLYVKRSLIDHSGNRLVRVQAQDKGTPPRSTTWDILITVIDENQHAPVFIDPDETLFNATTGELPEIVVEEELEIGTLLYTLKATDDDEGANGYVEYYLEPSTNRDFEYFRVNRFNGSLFSVKRLDYEEKNVFEIQVKAQDNGRPASLQKTITMRINLTDIDDNLPSYKSVEMPQELHVLEENATAVVGWLTPAVDKDTNPNNTIVCYYLYGGDNVTSFKVDKYTRLLSLKEKLDREVQGQLNIIIKASPNCSLDTTSFPLANNSSILAPPINNKTPSPIYNESDHSLLWVRVTVVDINDNPPHFVEKEISEAILYDTEVAKEIMSLQDSVTDADTPAHSKHEFKLLNTDAVMDIKDVIDLNKDNPFAVSLNGSVTTTMRFPSDLLGYFVLNVEVYDEKNQRDTADVKIFLISNMQRVKLVFNKLPNEVEQLKNDLLRELSDILDVNLLIDKIETHVKTDGSRDPTKTDAYIHGRYRNNGEIVPSSELWKMFDFNTPAKELLSRNGVSEALTLREQEQEDEANELKRMFAIVAALLGVIVVTLVLVLIHMVRLYRRRLRAATTMAYSSKNEKEMYEHPGTNKYFAAENPLFGKEIKPTILEDDRTSQNSLDENVVDAPPPPQTQDPDEEQEMVLQITDSAPISPQHAKDPNHNANLDQVLQAYQNQAFEDDLDSNLSGMNESSRPFTNGHMRMPSHANYIPGIGLDVQEGVTRFSDEIMSSDSGFPENGLTLGQSRIEYTDI